MDSRCLRNLAAVALMGVLPAARAIVTIGSGDPSYNTTSPTGLLEGSGWQYLGSWNGFVGTQISPSQFITASHVGGSVGSPFIGSDGLSYTTTGVVTRNDLAIWTVSGSLPTYAPLYTGSSETSSPMVLFGSGAGRGAEVRAPAATDANNLRGWAWGGTSALRWGTNQFDFSVASYPGVGAALVADFDRNGGADEATVAGGDSGGATFVRNGNQWQLAGVVFGVQSSVRTSPTGANMTAAIFDLGGLYNSSGSLIATDQSYDFPASFVVSRISGNQSWIVTQVPEASTQAAGVTLAAASLAVWRRRKRVKSGTDDAPAPEVALASPRS
jgi:hypothetical protein